MPAFKMGGGLAAGLMFARTSSSLRALVEMSRPWGEDHTIRLAHFQRRATGATHPRLPFGTDERPLRQQIVTTRSQKAGQWHYTHAEVQERPPKSERSDADK